MDHIDTIPYYDQNISDTEYVANPIKQIKKQQTTNNIQSTLLLPKEQFMYDHINKPTYKTKISIILITIIKINKKKKPNKQKKKC